MPEYVRHPFLQPLSNSNGGVISVSYCKELWDGRKASADHLGRRTYTRVYEVKTSDPYDNGSTVGAANGLPRRGESFPGDPFAYCVKSDPEQLSDDPTLWHVSVEYDSKPDLPEAKQPDNGRETTPQHAAELSENPLLRPPIWHFSFQQRQEVARLGRLVDETLKPLSELKTTGGKAERVPPKAGDGIVSLANDWSLVCNSAGDPFDPPAMRDRSAPIITVTINREFFSLVDSSEFVDTVNETAWRGLMPRTVRCTGIESESAYENGVSFWRTTWHLAVHWKTHDLRLLDAGHREKVPVSFGLGGGFKMLPMRSPYGDIGPELLNGKGRRLIPVNNNVKFDAAADTIRWPGHGFQAYQNASPAKPGPPPIPAHPQIPGDTVTFRGDGMALPAPLVAGVTYYVCRVIDDDTFQVTATQFEDPIVPLDILADGNGFSETTKSERYRRYSVYRLVDFNKVVW